MYMYLIAALFPSFSDEIIHPADALFNESRIKNHAERLELNEKYTLYIKVSNYYEKCLCLLLQFVVNDDCNYSVRVIKY